MKRRAVLALALGVVALTEPPAVKFVQPRSWVAIAGPRGVDIPVQAWVERHVDNRAFRLTITGRQSHAWAKTLDGEYEARTIPIAPLSFRLLEGDNEVRADVYGPGGELRASAVRVFKVCGGLEECGDSQRLSWHGRHGSTGSRGSEGVRADSRSVNSLNELARPAGFEPAAFGSGGRRFRAFLGAFPLFLAPWHGRGTV
jgi:hypothetical protein